MSSNEKGTSETVKVLAAETNHVGRILGWDVWNRPEKLSVMTKRDWSSIHSEVKEAESMKTIAVVWVPQWNKTKRGKNLVALSFLFWLYIYIYIYIYIHTYALWKQKIVECMYDWKWNVCFFSEGKLWMLEWLIPCPRMDMNELMCLLGKAWK